MAITLLTDFGLKDEYAGVMKGVILGICPAASVIDLTHEIPPGDVAQAGWVLSWSWAYFPKGTIHVVVVDPGVGSSRKIICLAHKGHLFLAPDNGVLSHVVSGVSHPVVYALHDRRYALSSVSGTFHGRDLIAPAAAHLAQGLAPHRLGPRLRDLKRLEVPRPVRLGRSVRGKVIAFDRYGNAVTNLPRDFWRGQGRTRPCFIRIKGRRLPLVPFYSAVPSGKPMGMIASRNLLEISVRDSSAQKDLRLRVGDSVEVRG